jgi:hypothetical protein
MLRTIFIKLSKPIFRFVEDGQTEIAVEETKEKESNFSFSY